MAVSKASDSDEATHYAVNLAREQMRKPVRYYITAGGATETVPADSPFATLVLKALDGAADFWKDGFISAEELGLYLQRTVPVHAKRPLHPLKGAIADETARLSSGQFMFLAGLAPPSGPGKAMNQSAIANALERASAAEARKDDAEAARLYRLAADQGDARAQAALGVFYNAGRGGLPNDDREAARLFHLAADQRKGIIPLTQVK